MLLLGLAGFLFLAGLYAGVTLSIFVALVVSALARGLGGPTRILFASWLSLCVTPVAWLLLHVPIDEPPAWYQPGWLWQHDLAFWLPLALVFALTWTLFPRTPRLSPRA